MRRETARPRALTRFGPRSAYNWVGPPPIPIGRSDRGGGDTVGGGTVGA